MNQNFLNAIKRIVAEQGEAILTSPQRLRGLVSDYAKNEPKSERLAFGRCIEYGFYGELKKAAAPEERARVKTALAQRLHNEEGLDMEFCAGALDLLEAVMYGTTTAAAGKSPESPPAPAAQIPPRGKPGVYAEPSPPEPDRQPPKKKNTVRNVLIVAGVLVVIVIIYSATRESAYVPPVTENQYDLDQDRQITEYTKVLELDPKNVDAYYLRAHKYINKKNYDQGIADYTKALELVSNFPAAYFDRGITYGLDKGDYDRAIADLSTALEVASMPDAYHIKYESGIGDFSAFWTLVWRGDMYNRKGDYDRAIMDFTEALQIGPNNEEAKRGLETAKRRGQ